MKSNEAAVSITGLQSNPVPTLLAPEQKKAVFLLSIHFVRPLFTECAVGA